MSTQYRCRAPRRRQEVLERKTLNGIDFLEIAAVDQKSLDIFFVHPLPGQVGEVPAPPHNVPPLTKDNFVITGGTRIKNPAIRLISQIAGNRLRLTVQEPGDYSTYTLQLVTSPTQPIVPPGFDPALAAIDFSFKVLCPSEFDCETETVCPPTQLAEPPISYLAKDYATFRRLMLDRMSITAPAWRERSPADMMVALVETLAYVGDHLSYFQDAVATEAYLGTARRRISVRRHARLLDYAVHDGCNARAWLVLTLPAGGGSAEGKVLPAGTPVTTRHFATVTSIAGKKELIQAADDGQVIFETCHAVTLRAARNTILFHTWSDEQCCLPRGATRATLVNDPPLDLKAGDVLVFEEVISPTTGLEADADRTHRHAVRLVATTDTAATDNPGAEPQPLTDRLLGTRIVEVVWHAEDALPFPLCLSALIADASGKPVLRPVSVACGNVVLADHGFTRDAVALALTTLQGGRVRVPLPQRDLTIREAYAPADPSLLSAAASLVQDPRRALPAVALTDANDNVWTVRRDLLGSDRFATDVVVELEDDGSALLRFGDDVLGQRPEPGTSFTTVCRTGNGTAGNVGGETLTRIFCDFKDILSVRNPLPAQGGTDAETLTEVREFAPVAFRTQQRAVTEADYVAAAEQHLEVRRASARFRWTGSWYTAFITIDRARGLAVDGDPAFEDSVRRHLERYRLAGYDLEIQGPVFVPLDVALTICVKPGFFRASVKEALLEELSNRDLPDGRRGFFHPDAFTFAQPVFVSQLYERTLKVPGVDEVAVTTFQRYGQPADNELAQGYLEPADLEIIRLDNDRSFPENGKLVLNLHGGL